MRYFFGIKSDYSDLCDARVWGCPAYLLDPKLQDGKKIPRWNPRTGAISHQFHEVYDEHFTTDGAHITGYNLPVPHGFDELMKLSR